MRRPVGGAREIEVPAIALRRSGVPFREIAVRIGGAPWTAHAAVMRVLDRTLADPAESAGVLRTMELERLDALLAAVWPAAVAGDLPAVGMALRVAERRARLLGLDAPTRQELTGADGGRLSFVSPVRRLLVAPAADSCSTSGNRFWHDAGQRPSRRSPPCDGFLKRGKRRSHL